MIYNFFSKASNSFSPELIRASKRFLSSCNGASAARLDFNLLCKSSNSNKPTLNCLLTKSIKPRDNALIKLPVRTVIKTAVLLGLKLNMLKRALPTKLPKRSPKVESTPPKISKERISNQPVTTK